MKKIERKMTLFRNIARMTMVTWLPLLLLAFSGCSQSDDVQVTISRITPAYGLITGSVKVTVSGSGFKTGATAQLTRTYVTDIDGAVSVDSSTQITAVFNLVGAIPGMRNLLVKNPDGKGAMAANSFLVMKLTVLYVGNFYGGNVLIYNSGDLISGAAVPDRTIQLPPASQSQPADVLLDITTNVLYVADSANGRILVYDNGNEVTGSAQPDRVITSSGVMANCFSISLDSTNNYLYVATVDEQNKVIPSAVLVFANASSANGNVTPARIIRGSGINWPVSVTVDTASNILYVANGGPSNNFIAAYSFAKTINGDAVPAREITGNFDHLADLVLDTYQSILYVTSYGNQRLLIYKSASTINGAVTPSATIELSSYRPMGLCLDDNKNMLFVSHQPNNAEGSVLVFENASSLAAGATPVRLITNLLGPWGMWCSCQ